MPDYTAQVSTESEAAPAEGSIRRADVVLALLAALIAGWALLHGYDAFGGHDWDVFWADLISARRSIVGEGELPLWMPFRVGGHDAFADPQSMWASPLGLLTLVFGVSWGIRAFLALSVFVAALGVQRLAASFGLGLLGRSTAALLFACSTPLGLYAAGGIPTFTLGLALLPWLTVAVLRDTRRGLLAAGAILALDFYGGDINHLVFHALFVTLLLGGRSLIERKPRHLLALILVAVSAATFSAPKLFPCALFIQDFDRPGSGKGRGAMTPRLLFHALLDRDAIRFVETPLHEFVVVTRSGELAHGVALSDALPETAVVWFFVGSYIGWAGLLLALLGLVVTGKPRGPPRRPAGKSHQGARDRRNVCISSERATPRGLSGRFSRLRRRRRELLLLAGVATVFLWLSLGTNVTPSGWSALHRLPVFSSLRSPERLLLYPFLGLAIFAGVGCDWLRRTLARRPERARLVHWCSVLLLLGMGFDVIPPSLRAYRQTFIEPDRYRLERLPAQTGFLQVHGEIPAGSTYYGPPVAPFAEAGLGVVDGYSSLRILSCALPRQDMRYRGEAFLLTSEEPLRPTVTARRLRVTVKIDRPDTLVFNQNWAPGWAVESPEGLSTRRHDDGRIAVDVPAGVTPVVLRYTSRGLWIGVLLGLLGSPLLIFGVLKANSRKDH